MKVDVCAYKPKLATMMPFTMVLSGSKVELDSLPGGMARPLYHYSPILEKPGRYFCHCYGTFRNRSLPKKGLLAAVADGINFLQVGQRIGGVEIKTQRSRFRGYWQAARIPNEKRK